jgi:secreted Zn-dependent insulinase-like peptidase
MLKILLKPAKALLVLVAVVLVACGDITNPAALQKSDNDQREYRYLTLDNQLQLLLISDPDADKAAASLDVNVGSRQDPQDYQGLAHFLEHMLFLGTDKYPEADEYQGFISSHSGGHNAYTSFEHTNYFFDIDPVYLEPALDRFARFFIAPLFTADYVEREKNAVHSEYTAKIKDENRKSMDVFKQVVNPAHPFSKLSVGNLETLKDLQPGSLRQQLLQFHQRYYSANLMTLVVLGNESLDALEEMVVPKFVDVANHNTTISPISEPLFKPEQLPMTLRIRPEQQQRVLTITFPTPSETPYYQQKPLHFIGNIIGHEGQGSLLSFLKQQGWAEGLSAGAGLSYQGGGSFSVSVKLTEAGVKHSEDIVTTLFQTLNRIRNSKNTQWIFDEQRIIAEQQFRFKEKTSSIHYARSLANDLHYYPAQDVLRGPLMMERYDAELIKHFLTFLTPENTLVSLNAPEVSTDKQSYWYQTPYQHKRIAQKTIQQWQQAGDNPAITLPVVNEFIAGNIDLIALEASSDVPLLIVDHENFKAWYQADNKFEQPKGNVFLNVRLPDARKTAQDAVLLKLYTALINDQLNEFSYPATLAGLRYSLHSHSRGLSIKISGFTDKQSLLLDKILQVMRAPIFDPQRFTDIQQEHMRQLRNADKQQPYHRLTSKLPYLLYENSWSEQQLLNAYSAIEVNDLQRFSQTVLNLVDVQLLIYGNYDQQAALSLAKYLEQALPSSIEGVEIPPVAILNLDNKRVNYQIESVYQDASAMLYLQAESLDKSTRALMGLSAQIMRADFYSQLRTEKQLGYIVTSGAYPVRDVPGMYFMVQSPVAGPQQLQQEIDHYIQQKLKQLTDIDEAQFERHRQALLVRLQEQPKNQWEQAQEYWQDIAQYYFQFDSRQQLIDAMKALKYDQWQQFFREQVAGSQRKIWLYNRGKFAEQAIIVGQPIGDVAGFKATQAYYTFQ